MIYDNYSTEFQYKCSEIDTELHSACQGRALYTFHGRSRISCTTQTDLRKTIAILLISTFVTTCYWWEYCIFIRIKIIIIIIRINRQRPNLRRCRKISGDGEIEFLSAQLRTLTTDAQTIKIGTTYQLNYKQLHDSNLE